VIVNFLEALAAFIVVLAPLVFFHEFGHFLAAKMFRIGVPVFSLGFGPRLFGLRRRETDYRVSLIPLGGYVRLAGDESDENRTGSPEEFLSRPKWQRFIVFVAGATFNIILAFLTLWLYFGVYGKEQVSDTYPTVWNIEESSPAAQAGILPGDRLIEISGADVNAASFLDVYNLEVMLSPNAEREVLIDREGELRTVQMNTGADPRFGWGSPGWSLSLGDDDPAVIASVEKGDRAEQAGLEPGDKVLAAGGREPISQIELRLLLMAAAEREIELRVLRDGAERTLTVVPRDNEGRGFIGVNFVPQAFPRVPLSVWESAEESLAKNLSWSKTLFVVLKRLVSTELPLRSMSGPIGIAQVARSALAAGFETFLWLLAFFSLQLGILNLLPIPVLDGGHILILLVESVMRRDLSERVKERVMQAGLVFLLAFMGVIVYLDVVKSF
jgi:regulator of sigma E protease